MCVLHTTQGGTWGGGEHARTPAPHTHQQRPRRCRAAARRRQAALERAGQQQCGGLQRLWRAALQGDCR